MAETNKYIKKILLPGEDLPYSIYDAEAIHSIEDLGLSSALVFKGTKDTEAQVLAVTEAKIGDVWLAKNTGQEFVCIKVIGSTADSTAWEKLGSLHDAASSTHIHDVTVTGTNASSSVTGSVTVPTVSKTTKYLKASATQGTVTPTKDNVLGEATTFSTTVASTKSKIKATASGTAVGGNGTVSAITALGTANTSPVLGDGTTFKATGGTPTKRKLALTTIKNPTVTSVSIPNVTDNSSVTATNTIFGENVTASKVSSAGQIKTTGTKASWRATVSPDGVLSFEWTENKPTEIVLPTFTSVTVPVVNSNTAVTASKVTLGEALSASSVTTSNVTVATGAITTTGSGADIVTDISSIGVQVDTAENVDAIIGFGTHTTKNVLTGVKVTAQPTIKLEVDNNATANYVEVVTDVEESAATTAGTTDIVSAVTGVTVGNPSVALSSSTSTSTGAVTYVESVTTGTTSANLQNGTAAAQKWTQGSGVTGQPKQPT